jgi:flagellar biosynthetic protein FlhB
MNLEFRNIFTLLDMETEGTLIYITDRVLGLARNLALILLALGLVDFYYQKRKHHESLKMSKQEVKEEFKQAEGNPEIKQKIRQKQREAAIKRMMGEVPQAEVVVRNPTHFAVAISYKPYMSLPVVVAKGKDKVALRIIEIAREAGVPLVENPPLARQLYRQVEVGEEIPQEFMKIIAEIIVSVMDAEKRKKYMEARAA